MKKGPDAAREEEAPKEERHAEDEEEESQDAPRAKIMPRRPRLRRSIVLHASSSRTPG